MTLNMKRAGLAAAAAALVAAAACRNSDKPLDDALKQDLSAAGADNSLQLAPNGARSQAIDLEDAPKAAPAPAARRPAPRPAPRAAPQLAAQQLPPAPAPAPIPRAEPRQATAQAPTAIEPPPLPPARSAPTQRQQGTYKTEAEIFQRMPWIRP